MKLEKLYALLDELNAIISKMRARGLDPEKYYDSKNDELVNLVDLANRVSKKIIRLENPMDFSDQVEKGKQPN